MPIKLNISEKGKAWKVEVPEEVITGKSVGDKISGKDVKPELEGYEFQITGGCDSAGFPLSKDVEGLGLKALLLKKGWGMKDNTEGMRRRKTVRGKVISENVSLINLNVLKAGSKKLAEVFPEQNQPKEKKAAEAKPGEAPKQA
ncbi:MAG: eS6 family ribosomal protein [archaeon]|jgi:small subunit ribosomal protein S6e|nr:eS6 family ribosomal protein [archaeon]